MGNRVVVTVTPKPRDGKKQGSSALARMRIGGLRMTDADSMTTTMATVDEYLASFPAVERAALENLRQIIKSAAPDATEGIGYGMPDFKYKGKRLISFGAWKHHGAIYGMNAQIAEEYQGLSNSFDVSGGTIRFAANEPLPPELVQKLVQARIDAIEATVEKK